MNNERINICKSHFVSYKNDNIYSHFSSLTVFEILYRKLEKGHMELFIGQEKKQFPINIELLKKSTREALRTRIVFEIKLKI